MTRIGADLEHEGSRSGQDVGVYATEASVEGVLLDSPAVDEQVTRLALDMAGSPNVSAELLEQGVDFAASGVAGRRGIIETHDPGAVEVGHVAHHVHAQPGELPLEGRCEYAGDQRENIGSNVLEERLHAWDARSLQYTTMSPPAGR